jgi:hypothetical protein
MPQCGYQRSTAVMVMIVAVFLSSPAWPALRRPARSSLAEPLKKTRWSLHNLWAEEWKKGAFELTLRATLAEEIRQPRKITAMTILAFNFRFPGNQMSVTSTTNIISTNNVCLHHIRKGNSKKVLTTTILCTNIEITIPPSHFSLPYFTLSLNVCVCTRRIFKSPGTYISPFGDTSSSVTTHLKLDDIHWYNLINRLIIDRDVRGLENPTSMYRRF